MDIPYILFERNGNHYLPEKIGKGISECIVKGRHNGYIQVFDEVIKVTDIYKVKKCYIDPQIIKDIESYEGEELERAMKKLEYGLMNNNGILKI